MAVCDCKKHIWPVWFGKNNNPAGVAFCFFLHKHHVGQSICTICQTHPSYDDAASRRRWRHACERTRRIPLQREGNYINNQSLSLCPAKKQPHHSTLTTPMTNVVYSRRVDLLLFIYGCVATPAEMALFLLPWSTYPVMTVTTIDPRQGRLGEPVVRWHVRRFRPCCCRSLLQA